MFLGVGAWRLITAQDALESDPQMQRFSAVTALLRQDQPAEAEHLLDQVELRSNRSKFKLGKSTISTYALTSTLLISTYLRLNDYTVLWRFRSEVSSTS
jgi:hypothetical protein